MGRSLLLSLVFVLVRTTPAAAQNSEDDARARRHFAAGESYYAEGDFESARREFLQSLRLSGRPQLNYNLYRVEERLGLLSDAVGHLERYLAEVPDAEDRPLLERQLANLRSRADRAQATPPGGAEAPAGTPTTDPFAPDEDSGSGDAADVDTAPRSRGAPIGAIVAYSAAGVGLLGAGIFGILTLSEDGSVAESCGAMSTATCTDDDLSSLHTFAILTDISFGVALVGAAIGTVLLFTGGNDEEPEPSVAAAPWLGPGSGGAIVTGRY